MKFEQIMSCLSYLFLALCIVLFAMSWYSYQQDRKFFQEVSERVERLEEIQGAFETQ